MKKMAIKKTEITKVLCCLVVIAILLSVVPVFKPEVSADAHTYVKNFKSEGIYVWGFSEAILTNNDEQKRFFELCKEEGIKTVFLSCDKTMLTTNPSIYADFIKKADVLQVHALDGNWDWAKDESNAEPFINAVLQYNSKTSYKFDGIHLDVEPGEINPDPEKGHFNSKAEFLKGYKDLLTKIKTKFSSYSGETILSQEMALSIDVGWWWPDDQSRNEFKELIGIEDLDYITIMAYYDNADDVFSRAKGVVNVAKEKNMPFVIALETQEFPGGILENNEFKPDEEEFVTFFEEGQSEFHKTLEQLQDRYKDNGLFKGFAIHFYQTSFTPWHIIESTKLPSGTFKPGDTVSVLVTLKTSDYFEDRPIAVGFSVRDDEGNVYPDDYIDDGLDVDTSKIILIKRIDKETVELEWTVPNFARGANYDLTISVWDIDYNYNRSISLFHKSILLENYPGDITQIGMHELSKLKVKGLRKFVELDRVDWIKDLFFVTKEPQDFTPLDLCMVLDRSGSMDESMGGKTKMQGVKEAATGVVNVLLPQDRVSIVSFSDTATANIDLTSDFGRVKTKINAITAEGKTSFGAGLEAALDQFKDYGNTDHNPAILFMSDGEHNKAPDPEAYVTQCKTKGIPIFTVGFATSESEVDVTKLKMMAEETGGEYHFVSKNFNLQNIFLRLQHKASGWESVAAYVGEVDEGETVTAGTFYVDPAIDDLRVTLNWPGSNLDLELFDPSNRQVDFGASNVIYSGDTKPEYVIIKDPQSGTWTTKVYGKSIGSSEEFYVLVTKYVPPVGSPVHNLNTGENFATIQSAIDDLDTQDGNTITVDPGTYTEHLIIDKSLKLMGDDKSTTIIEGRRSEKCVIVTADNVEISGFTIQNSTYGIWLESSDGCTISRNIIQDNCDGIYLTDSNSNAITNNILFNNVLYLCGIHLSSSHDNEIRDNDLVENGGGVSLRDSNNNRIYHNNFVDSIFNQAHDNSGTNSWDNGPTAGGNYWSDHGCIGNPSAKPYYIDNDGVDHYPFQDPNGWLKGNQPPVNPTLSPDKPEPQSAGAAITWTASATDPDGDPLYYLFRLKGPSTGNSWQIMRDWSTDNTWTWYTSSAGGDTDISGWSKLDISVWIRDGHHAPSDRYDLEKIYFDYYIYKFIG